MVLPSEQMQTPATPHHRHGAHPSLSCLLSCLDYGNSLLTVPAPSHSQSGPHTACQLLPLPFTKHSRSLPSPRLLTVASPPPPPCSPDFLCYSSLPPSLCSSPMSLLVVLPAFQAQPQLRAEALVVPCPWSSYPDSHWARSLPQVCSDVTCQEGQPGPPCPNVAVHPQHPRKPLLLPTF